MPEAAAAAAAAAAAVVAPRWCRLGGCLLQRNNVLLGRKVG